VTPDKTAQLFGNCEGYHEVMSGKLSFHLFFQPLPGFVILADGTMTISAGAKNGGFSMTFLTDENIAAAKLGATPDDILDNLFVSRRQTACKSCHVPELVA